MLSPADQDRLYFPATERNRGPIGDVLAEMLPEQGSVLEIASGSGEHAVTFQRRFPGILWQASDPDPSHCKSINAWIEHESLSALMPQALQIDALEPSWPLPEHLSVDLKVIVAINLIHIAPWSCCISLAKQASEILPIEGRLILYGPYRRNGSHTSLSNESFDQSLRERNPSWGVRDLEAVEKVCFDVGLKNMYVQELPANNLMISVAKSCISYR
jgi:hypothetical protein